MLFFFINCEKSTILIIAGINGNKKFFRKESDRMDQINTEISLQSAAEQAAGQTVQKTERQIMQEQRRKEIKEERAANKKREEERKKQDETSMIARFQRDMQAAKERNKKWKKKSVKINAASYMMRLANASTTTGVSGILRSARADQSFVKRSGASKAEIGKALSILKRVIANGNRKIAGLKKEQQMENRRREEKKNGNIKEMERLREELKKQRRARKARENAAIADDEQVVIHNHNDDMLCPNELLNEFSMDGLIRDLSDSMPGNGINMEVGADTGVCCASGGEAAALDITV